MQGKAGMALNRAENPFCFFVQVKQLKGFSAGQGFWRVIPDNPEY